MKKPIKVMHIITRMIIGGAQENTLLCCEDAMREYGDEVLLVTGPSIGPEGSLLDRAGAGGVPVEIVGSLRRPIHPPAACDMGSAAATASTASSSARSTSSSQC